MREFVEDNAINIKTLEQYVPVVKRVHGNSHPEFYEVSDLFEKIMAKLNDEADSELNLATEFSDLCKVTDNYKVPSDTCESYEAVYKMLSELDEYYQK